MHYMIQMKSESFLQVFFFFFNQNNLIITYELVVVIPFHENILN